jgi:uncharacterized protein YutE (UPF0331/DUF86 family)
MTLARQTETEILEGAARSLAEQGYDVFLQPIPSVLPASLNSLRPDGIAIGRGQKLVIQVAQEGPDDAKRVAELQRALKGEPDWKLHLVVALTPSSSWLNVVEESDIAKIIERASKLTNREPSAALLMAWASLEALGRARMQDRFARAQSPGRIVEVMASEGIITPSEAEFLREMARKRTAFIHGDLMQSIAVADVERFLRIVHDLLEPAAG